MSEHTPGPLTAVETRDPNWMSIQAETRDDVAMVYIDDTDMDTLAETQANVRLFTAAPELLSALAGLIRAIEGDYYDPAAVDRARVALAEALGLPIDHPATDATTGPVASQEAKQPL